MRKRKTQRNIPYNLGGYFPRRALLICGLSLGMSWIVEAVQAEVSGNSDLSVLSAQQNRSQRPLHSTAALSTILLR